MDEEIKYPRRNLIAEEIAWVVVVNSNGVEKTLADCGFVTTGFSEERLVRVIYDNQMNVKLNDGILNLLSVTPYKRGCIHCHDVVKDIVRKASCIC